MFRFFAVFFLLLLFTGPSVRATVGAQITFEYLEFDKGNVLQGTECMYAFPFQNTGDEPLIISMVKSSCGCLVPYGPKDPVYPGDRDTIWGRYDSKRLGPINKTLTVYSNAKNYESHDGYISIVTIRILGSIVSAPLELSIYSDQCVVPEKIDRYNSLELPVSKWLFVVFYIENNADSCRSFSFVDWREGIVTIKVDDANLEQGETFMVDSGERVMVVIKTTDMDYGYNMLGLLVGRSRVSFNLRRL